MIASAKAQQEYQDYKNIKKTLKQKIGTNIVSKVNPTFDTFTLQSVEGTGIDIPIHHPFISTNSWIRTVPELTTGLKTIQGNTEYDNNILGYYFPDRDQLIKKYKNKVGVYRPLRQGEIEINSKGLAQNFFSSLGKNERHGGIVEEWLDHDTLESGQYAPIHRRKLHKHMEPGIQDEERLGVVTRIKDDDPIKTLYSRSDSNFLKEYLLNLVDSQEKSLLDIRRGNVVEDDGTEAEVDGKKLRLRDILYTDSGNTTTKTVDVDGNISLETSADAKLHKVDVVEGDVEINIKGSLTLVASDNKLIFNKDGITFESKHGTKIVSDNMGVTINGHNIVYHEYLDYFGQTHLISTGLGPMGWQTMHNPSTISVFNAKGNIPGQFKSNSARL